MNKWYTYFTAFKSNFLAIVDFLNDHEIMWECERRKEGYYFSLFMSQTQHDKLVEFIFSDAIIDEP